MTRLRNLSLFVLGLFALIITASALMPAGGGAPPDFRATLDQAELPPFMTAPAPDAALPIQTPDGPLVTPFAIMLMVLSSAAITIFLLRRQHKADQDRGELLRITLNLYRDDREWVARHLLDRAFRDECRWMGADDREGLPLHMDMAGLTANYAARINTALDEKFEKDRAEAETYIQAQRDRRAAEADKPDTSVFDDPA